MLDETSPWPPADAVHEQRERWRRTELLLQCTGELANVGAWELELALGRPVWSAQTCRIHGVPVGHQATLEEAIDFYAPAARPLIRQAVERSMQDGSAWDLELPFAQADGTPLWVRTVGRAEFEQGRPVRLLGAFQDISAQVRQRLALEAAHHRLAMATQSGGIGVWEIDLARHFQLWDARMCEIYGQPEGFRPTAADFWRRLVHPDDRARLSAEMARALAGAIDVTAEFRIRHPDGRLRHLRGAARPRLNDRGEAIGLVGVTWDITPVSRLSAELAEQHELLRVTLEAIGDAVITTGAGGLVNWLNPAAERLTGWLNAEAAGQAVEQVFQAVGELGHEPSEGPVRHCLLTGQTVALASAAALRARDGREFSIEASVAPIRNARGELLGTVLVFRDVSEQRRMSRELKHRASHDPLTGLANRAEFELRIARALRKSVDEPRGHALLYIDLDQFKLVNDACGHGVGDQLLVQVARVLNDCVRSRDTVARIGGDEFAVILENCSCEQAQRVAQSICDRMDEFRFVHAGRRFRIGASIGLVEVDGRWPDAGAVMRAADSACYAAKEPGRNCVHAWFDSDAERRTRQGQTQWASRLAQALDEGGFALLAQRIEPLGPADPGLHAEVLVRLQDGDGTLLAPGAFMAAAERFSLAPRLDCWVLGQVITLLLGLPDLAAVSRLSVNLSAASLADRAFHAQALALLAEAGAAVCARLCLEISESTAIAHLADTQRFSKQARELGVRVALDDFGAAASSFGYLKTLPVDLLKIDGQFLTNLLADPFNDAAVRSFVEVARVAGALTVAKWVDTPALRARVCALGVDFAQGHWLHRPEPLATLLAAPAGPGRDQYHGAPGGSAAGQTADRLKAPTKTIIDFEIVSRDS